MLHEIENTGLHIAKLSGAVWVVNQLPDVLNAGGDGNIITRALKKGFLLYVANETVEWATLGNSNFNKMGEIEGWKNLADDTFFYGVGDFIDEQAGITLSVKRMLPQNTIPDDITDSVIMGSYLYGLKWVGSKLENNMIKRISDVFSNVI